MFEQLLPSTSDWLEIKQAISEYSGLNMDALHVHAGVLIQLAAALLMRRSLASPWPWLVVMALTLANEFFDLRHEQWPDRTEQQGESVRDVWNTMLLPTVLLVTCRVLPSLFRRQARPSGVPTESPVAEAE